MNALMDEKAQQKRPVKTGLLKIGAIEDLFILRWVSNRSIWNLLKI